MPSSPESGPITTWAWSASTRRRTSDSAFAAVSFEQPYPTILIGCPAITPPLIPALGTAELGLAPSCAMKYACAPPMSELYQAPKSPAQSDRMPILIGVPAAVAVELSQVAAHSPAAVHSTRAANDRRARRRLSCLTNLSTSSCDCYDCVVGAHVAQPSPRPGSGGPPTADAPAASGRTGSCDAPAGDASGAPSRGPASVRSFPPMPISPSGDNRTISRKISPMIVAKRPGPSQRPSVGVY